MAKFLTGLLAGIAIGILLAPDKGSETRKKVSQKASDLKDQLDDFVDNASDTLQAVKDKANDFLNKGKKKAEDFRSQTSSPPPQSQSSPNGWNG